MKYGDDIIYDLTPETIVGPQLGGREIILELIPGDKYEIHYGIHQGIYRYEGVVADNKENRKNHPHSIKEHMFRKIDTGDLTFGFYGYHEPSLFTRICTHCESK
jgi:hypothetical protein